MSITITGGISFSGGVGIVAPPSTVNAGWYGGGSVGGSPSNTSIIQRILFATDTATATVRGPLSVITSRGSSTGTNTDGWFGGGDIAGAKRSTVQRITYATDTATASVRGPMAVAQVGSSASTTDGTTYGWWGGGTNGSDNISNVQRITYATDTATASLRGPLSAAIRYLAGTGTSTSGWFGGGYSPGAASPPIYITTTVNRITYATDTATASVRGPLSAGGGTGLAAVTDLTTYGWFGGGYTPASQASTVERITYATDTATASVRGPLSVGVSLQGATTDGTTYGWFGGGVSTSPRVSTVQRITYATDTATAGVRGPLASAAYKFAGSTSGIA